MYRIYSKCFVSLLSVALASFAVLEYLNWRQKKKTSSREIHEVIMFSEPSALVQNKLTRSTVIAPGLVRVLHHLNSTKQTLDICMYILTNPDIAQMIQKLNYRRVKVRLIIDADMAYSTGSAVRKLEKQGVEVRWMKSTNYMHHKYCLIDASSDVKDSDLVPIVMAGSLNWTNQACAGNWEDVIVTSQPQLVEGYRQEFEKLWVKFKPIVS